ncbi:late control protein D [Clostridium sp. ZBS15]|uniref:late control protein D n=1 Tax=Clostridium sp. ZBS15 TaxID=2949969 RepID=UPI00338DE51B
MGAIHALRIKSPYKLLHVEDIEITYTPNEHGKLYLNCLLDDSINFKYSIEASTKDEITIYEEKEDENNNSEVDINNVDISKSVVIFNGIVENIKTTNKDGLYYIEIEGISKSSELDMKEKSRSFQNINMTYDELIKIILNDYSGFNFTQCIGEGQAIGKPLFQYKETDWNFLKRIASELKSEIYCDIIDLNNTLYFGTNNGKSYELQDIMSYKACKDLKTFYKAGGYDLGFHDTDYFYYEIKSRERYSIGDNIYFKQKDVYVSDYEAHKYQDEIIYKYKLRRKNGVWQTKIYNSLLCGASLEGKVLAVEGEEVKLHLSIDENQDEGEGSRFKYAPPTGNTMYSMPVVGTSAKLYFPDESGNEPLVSGCVRSNGCSCAKTSDTTKRYFGTEHGSELEMTPSALNIKGGSASPISISIDDSVGIKITSPKKLTLSADSEIIMKTPKNVKINGVSQISALKSNTQSGFSLETDLHFTSDNIIKNGSCSESYPDFDDEPQAGKIPEPEPPKEEKKGFNWKKLAVGALAVASPVGGAVVACAVLGAVVSASVDVGCQLATNGGDISKVDPYQTVIAACGGALSGAFAATPIGVEGQIAINGAIGGTQAALNGGDAKDIAKGIGIGMLTGKLGGDGYKPTLHFWNRLYTTDGIKAVKGGVIWGAKISGIDTVISMGSKFVKEKYNEITQRKEEVPNAN